MSRRTVTVTRPTVLQEGDYLTEVTEDVLAGLPNFSVVVSDRPRGLVAQKNGDGQWLMIAVTYEYVEPRYIVAWPKLKLVHLPPTGE